MMETSDMLYYKIADLYIQITADLAIQQQHSLSSFKPFQSGPPSDEKDILLSVDFTIEKRDEQDDGEKKLLSDISIMWEESFRFQETDKQYLTTILAREDQKQWVMSSTKDFSSVTIYGHLSELKSTQKLSWLIMVAFGQACLKQNTLMLHASVIEKDGQAFAFLGKSGTGKSTHSRLWLENIPGTELLNDDNPAVRIGPSGEITIYGTPWSGKTVCFKQKSAHLQAIIRLEQAKENIFKQKIGMEAIITLLPSGSAIRWNNELYSSMLNLLEMIVSKTTVAHLQCLPNAAAAKLCYEQAALV